jgi:uncharacterized protein YbjT (DUF2867 family)
VRANDGDGPVLVTGAGGGVGGIGRMVVERLVERGYPVRAMVHREDDRAEALRALGSQVVVGDLTVGPDVVDALRGCARMYFSMSVSDRYLEATTTVAAAARAHGGLRVLVNMSQMTVSQMDLQSVEESRQQRLHWLSEQVLDWSGLPVVTVRPTVFMENPLFQVALATIAEDGVMRLPFGTGRSSPVAARDVADVVATVLAEPDDHIGRRYELTGGASRDLTALADEFAAALGRPVRYESPPLAQWRETVLGQLNLPDHVRDHIATMARLHALNRYDRQSPDVERLLGRPPTTITEFLTHPR